jgi:hypothetical protein
VGSRQNRVVSLYEQCSEIGVPYKAGNVQKLALKSPNSGGRSVGIVRLRTNIHGVFVFVNISISYQLFGVLPHGVGKVSR